MVRRESMSGANGGGRKTSQRLQLACEPCRSAKLKCDRTLPVCEQCYKRSRELSCKYTEKGLRYIAVAQKASSMKEKIERLELLVSRIKEPRSMEDVEHAVDTIGQGEPELLSRMGKIKLSRSGSTQWVGPSHWESIIDDIADVKAYFEVHEEVEKSELDSGVTPPGDDVPNVDITLGTANILRKSELLDRMPSKTELDRLVAAWFNVMDPARIMVHAPTFQQQYHNFWLSPADVEPGFLSLILAMVSLGAQVSGQMLDDASILAQAELLARLAAHAFVLADASRPQPHIIEALLLYVIGLLYRHHDTTTQVWHIIGMTMRLCHQAGYHRDPSRNPSISQFDAEMRRRVWMVACELDISVSNTLGMVSCKLNHQLCDTAFPANFLDTDFSPTHFGQPKGHEECTLVQVEISFTKLILILDEVVTSTHTVQAPSTTEVEAFHSRLVEAKTQLPEKLKMIPLDQCLIDSPFDIVERLRIDFVYQRAVCTLYRRYLGVPNRQTEHQRCSSAAHTIVQHCISMLEAAQPGGQLSRLKVVLVRHIHDFILGAMLLCLELKRIAKPRFGQSDDGQEDMIRARLLKACQLWNTPGIPSTKAQVALNTIMTFLTSEPVSVQQPNFDTAKSPPSYKVGEEIVLNESFDRRGDIDSASLSQGSMLPTPPEGSDNYFSGSNMFLEALDMTCTPGDMTTSWNWLPGRDSLVGHGSQGELGTLDEFMTVGMGMNEWTQSPADIL